MIFRIVRVNVVELSSIPVKVNILWFKDFVLTSPELYALSQEKQQSEGSTTLDPWTISSNKRTKQKLETMNKKTS